MSGTVAASYPPSSFHRAPSPTVSSVSSQSNPIDLTLDDDDDNDGRDNGVHANHNRNERGPSNSAQPFASSHPWGSSSGPLFSPGISKQGFSSRPEPSLLPPALSSGDGRSAMLSSGSQPSVFAPPYHSGFSQFSAARLQHAPSPLQPPPPTPSLTPSPGLVSRPLGDSRVIDLTSSPSPPPVSVQSTNSNLPADLPMKTPVCIGQLAVTALVLYPISYLRPQEPGNAEAEWASVRVQYEHMPNKPVNARETIHIKSPNWKSAAGEVFQGEAFGVVEQKVANVLGPMLGKGLIRLDGKVRRGLPNLPILPLQMLVYTPKGNINIVGNFLQEHGLLLDHPTPPYDIQRLANYHYHNPHNPPPGGHARALLGANPRLGGFSGLPGSLSGRWSAPAVSGKSVEVQRNQAEELFKSLRSGDELEETEPTAEVATKLYPHQKKALTFLLEREHERTNNGGSSLSLWSPKQNPFSGQNSWVHLVTQKEVFQEPFEAKGAILADDMGLGKTITCVSLIAATLDNARAFASDPLPPPPPPPDRGPDLSAAHFVGTVWGMPDASSSQASTSTSAKAKAKANREADKREADYARATRIKTKTRATLIVCPLSTISNWEDQFREHWKGEVTVVGGSGVCSAAPTPPARTPSALSTMGPLTQSLLATENSDLVLSKPGSSKDDSRGCRVYVYHGNARRPDPGFLADFDAVITTYSTLATEFSKQSKSVTCTDADDDDECDAFIEHLVEVDEMGNQIIKIPQSKKGIKRKKANPNAIEASSPLQSVFWFRVVLDEAHSIKETATVACRACCDLMADRRLCLTGTPVQNKLDDVFALIKFLRLEPFDDKNVWTEFIGAPVKYGQPLGVARLQTIMKCITLRRTKETRTQDGVKILSLPPRRDELRYLKFDQQEQGIYDQFFSESQAEFQELSNKNEVMKNYVGILQKILRLRQICDHFELVQGKTLHGDSQGKLGVECSFEEIVAGIEREGFTPARAAAIFALIRDSATAQCVECGFELCTAADASLAEGGLTDMSGPPPAKRGRKPKVAAPASRVSTRQNSPVAARPVLTKCQHLFCMGCYQSSVFPSWPQVPPDVRRPCTVCQATLAPTDALEINPDSAPSEIVTKKKVKREKRAKGVAMQNFHPSTKVKALLGDLIHFSRANPHSANYDPSSIEIQMVDDKGNDVDDGVVKTVVFSQWTTMLDKIEDALDAAGIRYDRLDGTMKRDDRTRAMEALKTDPGCEVLLVSLKAGGVGLNLTAAQRVYLMDPYWNPAVENQAVDRIHRLGQTRPVTTVKLIIENSIEARLLEVQAKKTALANMTLSQNLSKAEILQRRMEELSQLFGS